MQVQLVELVETHGLNGMQHILRSDPIAGYIQIQASMFKPWGVSDCYWSRGGVDTIFHSGVCVEELRKCVKGADAALKRKHS